MRFFSTALFSLSIFASLNCSGIAQERNSAVAGTPVSTDPSQGLFDEYEYSLSVQKLNSVQTRAGSGPAKSESGNENFSIFTEGIEISECEPAYGRKSSAKAEAKIVALEKEVDSVKFTLISSASANGGHYRYYRRVFGQCFVEGGRDTRADSSAKSEGVVRIKFRDSANSDKYYLRVVSSENGNEKPDFLLEDSSSGTSRKITHGLDPTIIETGPSKTFLLRASLETETSGAGGCPDSGCESEITKSSVVEVFLEPVPVAFSNTNTPFILNGTEADPGQYQEVVAITYKNKWENKQLVCSGTLVSPLTILTAAHCIQKWQKNIKNRRFVASVGKFQSQPEEERTVVDYDFPDGSDPGFKYNNKTYEDDVGVLYLESPFSKVSNFPKRHAGSPNWEELNRKQASLTLVGFGLAVDENGKLTDAGVKRYVTIPFAGYSNRVVKYNYEAAGGGACKGDSGGATYLTSARHLAGVTSSGVEGCKATGSQMRVDAYKSWLDPRIK